MEIGVNIAEPSSVAKPFQCTICDKFFTRKPNLEEHILKKHVDDKEFQCTACLETKQLVKSFATQHILNKHIKRVHGPARFKCHVCLKTFKDSSNFAAHTRIHFHATIKEHKCALCPAAYRFKCNLQIHLFNVHKQRRENVNYYKCEICSREFVKRAELERHVVHQHVVDKAFKCLVCSKTFIDQQSLEKHIKGHDRQNEYICDVCTKGFTMKKSLVNHLGVKHKYFFYCDKCLNSYKNKADFDAHISDSKQELKCSICQEIINSKCNLKIHTDSHVKEIKTKASDIQIENAVELVKVHTVKSTKEVNSNNFHCQICSKTFDREAYFSSHRREMHSNAEWKCDFDQCSKSYRWYNQLRLHKMEHAETKKFVCNICQKSFYRPNSLRDHQQIHVKEKKYKCYICPKSFATPSRLRTHIANSHGGLKPFKCPVVKCGTFWATNFQLNSHLISHQTEKSFQCELCTRFIAFKTLKQLKDHKRRVHSETKKNRARSLSLSNKFSEALVFICSSNACSFETVNEKAVALHLNEQHALPKVVLLRNISGSTTMSKEPQKIRNMIQKQFRCDICFKLFKSAPTLSMHQVVHSNATPFKCPVCSKSIKCKRNLTRHVKNFHNKKSTKNY